jgi:hypothetical protein
MKFNCECDYCKRNTYLWQLKNGIVWVEIPKNGSYNLKEFKFKYDSRFPIENQKNSILNKIQNIDTNIHKRAFTIIRNPIDRFKSLVSHYFINGSRNAYGKSWLTSLGIQETNSDKVVSDVLKNWHFISKIFEPHHFNSQKSFIPNEFFEIPHMIYNVSELNLMFGLQVGINSSNSSGIKIYDNDLEKIIKIYEDDINLYSKYFDLNLY